MERTTMGITLHWICAWYTVNREYYLTIILFRLPYIPNTHVSFIRFHCSLCFWPFTIFGTIGGRIRRLWTVLCKLLRRDGYSVDSWSESYGKSQSQKLCLLSCHRFLSLPSSLATESHTRFTLDQIFLRGDNPLVPIFARLFISLVLIWNLFSHAYLITCRLWLSSTPSPNYLPSSSSLSNGFVNIPYF